MIVIHTASDTITRNQITSQTQDIDIPKFIVETVVVVVIMKLQAPLSLMVPLSVAVFAITMPDIPVQMMPDSAGYIANAVRSNQLSAPFTVICELNYTLGLDCKLI
jgi:hypothetical protein